MTALTLTSLSACNRHCQIMLCNTLADTGCGTLFLLRLVHSLFSVVFSTCCSCP